MAEPSIMNPELFAYSQLIPEIKLKHSIPSSCDSASNAQDREKTFDFTCGSIQTQVTENHCSKKSSGLIWFNCREPLVSMMINYYTTIFHLDRSTIHSFVFGGSGRYVASLIPGIMKDPHPPVRKAADTESESGDDRDESPYNSDAVSSEGSNHPYDTLEYSTGSDSGFGCGSDGGNGNGNGNDNDDDGGDENVDCLIQIQKIAIHLDDWYVVVLDPMQVPINALRYKSWKKFAKAICSKFWVYLNPENDVDKAPVEYAANPNRWYPLCLTPFGRLEEECFYHLKCDHAWDTVKLLIKDVCVITN